MAIVQSIGTNKTHFYVLQNMQFNKLVAWQQDLQDCFDQFIAKWIWNIAQNIRFTKLMFDIVLIGGDNTIFLVLLFQMHEVYKIIPKVKIILNLFTKVIIKV